MDALHPVQIKLAGRFQRAV